MVRIPGLMLVLALLDAIAGKVNASCIVHNTIVIEAAAQMKKIMSSLAARSGTF
jgi:hypothetical protein